MSHNRTPGDTNNTNTEKTNTEKSTVGSFVHGVAQGLNTASTGAKVAGQSLPQPVSVAKDIANLADDMINNPGKKSTTDIVCGGLGDVAKNSAKGILTTGVGVGVAAATPTLEPVTRVAAGFAVGVAAQPAINELSKPVGKAAEKVCRVTADVGGKAVNAVRGWFASPETPKQAQKQQAQQKLTETHTRDKSINSFQPNIPSTIPLAKYHSYNTPYYPHHQPFKPIYIPFDPRFEVRRMLIGLPYSVQLQVERYVDMHCGYMNFQMNCGYSYSSLSYFSNTLSMNGLINSYNMYNIQSLVRDAIKSYGEIGGVANEVGLIPDLINSEAHAKAKEYFFCFPKTECSFPQKMRDQMLREVTEGYLTHKTLPFVSIHFNSGNPHFSNKTYTYPVMHPFFKKTLSGSIVAFLDYWMKAFANGGAFDRAFLEKWATLPNFDEQHLRAHIIDLKKYAKEKAPGLDYICLREVESRVGSKGEKVSTSTFKQPFMASFRIIAYLKEVRRFGNILIPSYDFKIEYDIDLRPDYKEYLEQYHKEHGDYPEDYELIRQSYVFFAEEIKNKMPKMPLFKEYFELLGMMNSYCYALATWEQMGKMPVFAQTPAQDSYTVPKAFPPLPIRYFETYPLNTTVGAIFKGLSPSDIEALDKVLFQSFIDRELTQLPDELKQKLKQVLSPFIKTQMAQQCQDPYFECNEDEVDRISTIAEQFIYINLMQSHQVFSKTLQDLLKVSEQQTHIKKLTLPEQIKKTETILTKQYESVNAAWTQASNLEEATILKAFSPIWQEQVRENLAKLKKEVHQEIENLIYMCQKLAGTLTPQELMKPAPVLTEGEKKEAAELEKIFQQLEQEISGLASQGLQELQDEKTLILNAKQNVEQSIALIQQEIAKIQQHKASQLATIPAHLHAQNAQNIAKFCAPLDQEIQRLTIFLTGSNNEPGLNEELVIIQKAIQELDQAIQDAPNKKAIALAAVKKANCEKLVESILQSEVKSQEHARKAEALRLLEIAHKQNIARLHQMNKQVNHYAEMINTTQVYTDHCLSKKYTHAMIGFPTQEQLRQKGDHFNVVGGCGMNLSQVLSKPIEHADEFSLALANAILKENDTYAEFQFNKQNYFALKVQVKNIKNAPLPKPYIHTKAQKALLELIQGTLTVQDLPQDYAQAILDSADASMIHYAAAALNSEDFQALASKCPGDPFQLKDKLGNTPLHFAAKEGNVKVVTTILSQQPNLVDSKNNDDITPLVLAIQHNQLEVVKELIRFKADFNVRLPNGLFPLYLGLQANVKDIVLWLLDHAAVLNLNQQLGDKEMTALHLAIDMQAFDVANKLVTLGAACTVKRVSDGFTALHCAIKKGALDLVKLMVSKGVSLNAPLESKKTVLHIAAESGQRLTLEYLITQDVDLSAQTHGGENALMRAIQTGHLEEAQLLAQYSPVNQVNTHHQTASLLALQYGMPSVADILISRGEDPGKQDNQGYSYLFYLIHNGEAQRFSALLKKGIIKPSQSLQGKSLLELAVQFGQFLIVYALLDQTHSSSNLNLLKSAIMVDEVGYLRDEIKNVNPSESQLSELIDFAAKHSHVCLDWLLQRCDQKQLNFATLVKNALEFNPHLETIEHILKLGDIDAPLDDQGNTALHLAVRYGLPQVVDLLLSQGSLVTLRNKNNHTPFHIALNQDDSSILKKLLKKTNSKKEKEWPVDLIHTTINKPSKAMLKTLEFYIQQLPTPPNLDFSKPVKPNVELPTLLLNNELEQGLKLLSLLLKRGQFEEAAELLEEKPTLLALFKSKQGASLLKILFFNLHDVQTILASLKDNDKEVDEKELKQREEELHLQLTPNRLLTLLKQNGIHPALYTGKYNVLLTMIYADTGEEAMYRFNMLAKYFPESLAPLALDEDGNGHRFIELALKLNKINLFKALDNLCKKQSDFYSLHEAVLANNYKLVQDLMQSHHEVNSINQHGQTPFMLAATMNNVRMMELLLSYGANQNKVDVLGQNVLHHALNHKAESAALYILPLLQHKNNPDRQGVTPLMCAAAKGILPVLIYLCEQGDYSLSFDKEGLNALHHASLEGQTDCVAYLIKQDFSINEIEQPQSQKKNEKSLKRSPLHLATLEGHLQTVYKLIELGANIEQEDSNKDGFCEYAVHSKNIEMQELAQSYSFYDERDKQILLSAAKVDNEEAICRLILKEAPLNAINKTGDTALHLAAKNNASHVMKRLLQGGDLPLDITDQNMLTPLQYAALNGHVWPLKLLCKAGADINYHNSQISTALFLACAKGHIGAVTILLKYKADITLTDQDGLTPGQMALINHHFDIAKHLYFAGDKSLNPESFTGYLKKLPETRQKQIEQTLIKWMSMPKKSPIQVGGALIQNGIYRIQPKKPEASIQISFARTL